MNKKHLPISIAIIILILCVVFYLYKKNNDNDDDILSKVSKSLKTAFGQTGGATDSAAFALASAAIELFEGKGSPIIVPCLS